MFINSTTNSEFPVRNGGATDFDRSAFRDRDSPEHRAQCTHSSSPSTSGQENNAETDLTSLVYVENLKIATVDKATLLKTLCSCSWSEAKLHGQVKQAGRELIAAFAKRHILRCYPSAKRILSDNFDPSLALSIGAQVVALNFQADDISMWINRGKFLANGGCGFIRKPEYLISTNLDLPDVPALKLVVTVVACSGWNLFEKLRLQQAPSTYVRVCLTGSILDNKSHVTSTFSTHDRIGPRAQPFFNETFSFDVFEPRLSALLFTVHNKQPAIHDTFLAQSCFPVTLLRPGTRLVPLYDESGKYVGEDGHTTGITRCRRVFGYSRYILIVPL